LTSDLIQDKYLLHEILYFDELKEILPEDLIFDLQGLLISRFGSNLRNKLSHGLAELEELTSVESIYLWWLVLHLCCHPFVYQRYRVSAEQPQPATELDGEETTSGDGESSSDSPTITDESD